MSDEIQTLIDDGRVVAAAAKLRARLQVIEAERDEANTELTLAARILGAQTTRAETALDRLREAEELLRHVRLHIGTSGQLPNDIRAFLARGEEKTG